MFGWLFSLFGRWGVHAGPPPSKPYGWAVGDFHDIEVRTINMHPIRCPNCREPLVDGNPVVASKSAARVRGSTEHAHARCAILVQWPTGIRWLDGTLVTHDALTKRPPVLFLLLADECRALGLSPRERPVDAPKVADKA